MHVMRNSLAALVAVLTVALVSIPNAAQEMVRMNADEVVIMNEIGAIAQMKEGEKNITFARLFPKDARPAENRDVDVKQGDAILMMNGDRVRSIADFRALYEGLEKGTEIKLGIKRESERFLVSFDKGDPQAVMSHSSGGGMRMVISGDQGDVELLHEARALLGEKDGTITVTTGLPGGGDLEEGDVITEVNGQTVTSLAEYRAAYAALEVGDALKLSVKRGDEQVEIDTKKADMPAGMRMQRGDG